jgi:hypothetical protein
MKMSGIVLRLTFVAAFVCAASFACGKDGVIEKRVEADTPAKFADTQAAIHNEMAPGGRYEFIKPDAKAQVEVDLAAISALLQKSGSVAQMSQPDKVQLFNLQEHVNGVLTHSDGNRLVCEHRPPMGSNIAVTSCKTVAETEKMRRDAQKYSTDQTQVGWKCKAPNPACSGGGKFGH